MQNDKRIFMQPYQRKKFQTQSGVLQSAGAIRSDSGLLSREKVTGINTIADAGVLPPPYSRSTER